MDFSKIECFVLFIGHPRNGSTILGGLLDAHKNIGISHELDVLQHFNKRQDIIFQKIVQNCRDLSIKGRIQSGYKADVKKAWQGKWDSIHVLGDKKADWTALRIKKNPKCLQKWKELIKVPVKIIHTVRNPLDNIATIYRRRGTKKYTISESGGHKHMPNGVIGFYFDDCANGVLKAKKQTDPENWIETHNEDLISNPRKELTRIINFLGQEVDDKYLNACSNSIFKSYKKTRDLIDWKKEELQEIKKRSKEYEFLSRYF